jgi:hypothetical protein
VASAHGDVHEILSLEAIDTPPLPVRSEGHMSKAAHVHMTVFGELHLLIQLHLCLRYRAHRPMSATSTTISSSRTSGASQQTNAGFAIWSKDPSTDVSSVVFKVPVLSITDLDSKIRYVVPREARASEVLLFGHIDKSESEGSTLQMKARSGETVEIDLAPSLDASSSRGLRDYLAEPRVEASLNWKRVQVEMQPSDLSDQSES